MIYFIVITTLLYENRNKKILFLFDIFMKFCLLFSFFFTFFFFFLIFFHFFFYISFSPFFFFFSFFHTIIFRIPHPSSYTADSFDIFLRIVSPAMFNACGNTYLKLLLIINKDILPKLQEDSSRVRLAEFLQTAIESRGSTFLPFFK